MRTPHVWNPGDTLENVEMDLILSALRQTQGNLSHVSTALGIARSTLYKRLDKVGLTTQPKIMDWLKSYGPVS